MAISIQRPDTHRAHRLGELNARGRRLVRLHSRRVMHGAPHRTPEISAYADLTDVSRVFLHRRRLTYDGVDSAHAIDCTTRNLATEVARTREAGARKPVWPSSLAPVRFARKRLERRPRAPKNARSRHPCRKDAGDLGRYRRRGPGPARRDLRGEPLAPARCFATQSANDRCSPAPEELR